MIQNTSSDMSQIRDSKVTVNHKSTFWSAPWAYWPNFRAVPVPWMQWLPRTTSALCFWFTSLLGLVGYLYVVLRPGQVLKSFDFVTAETASNCSHGDASYDNCSEPLKALSIRRGPKREWFTGSTTDVSEGWKKQWSDRTHIQNKPMSDMLAYFEWAAEGQREMVQQMLEYITDLSSDEALQLSMPVVIVMQSTQDSLPELPQLSSMVWRQHSCVDMTAMAQRAIRVKVSPQADPRTSSRMICSCWSWSMRSLQLKVFLLLTLRCINGRLERAQRSGNNGKIVRFLQSNLVAELHFSSAGKLNGREAENQRGDQRNKWDERKWKFSPSWTWRTWKAGGRDDGSQGLWMLRGPAGVRSPWRDRRAPWPAGCSDESMPAETISEKARRFADCGQTEASDPDFWALVHYGPGRDDSPPDGHDGTGDGVMEFWVAHGPKEGSLVRGWIPIGGFSANFSQWTFSLWNGSKKENTMAEHIACGTCVIVMVDETSTSRRGETHFRIHAVVHIS